MTEPRGVGDNVSALERASCPSIFPAVSTVPRQPGILMNVHPILREYLKRRQPQSSRLGSDGQPTESSQLARSC